KAVQAQLDSDAKATFWVRMKRGADLSGARRAGTKEAKAEQVYEAKTRTAESAQAGLRKLLDQHRAEYTPFWIVNAVKVTAGSKLAAEISGMPEVDRDRKSGV